MDKKEDLPQLLSQENHYASNIEDTTTVDVGQDKLHVNQQHLKNAWEASQKSTREDWQEWIRRFSVELLKESPSHALRACANLAATYHPLARDLFNSAFVSCWTKLYDQYQEDLVRSLETAITSQNIPPEILQTLLNLAEFMEHDDKALPIDIRVLGKYAAKCHAFAKALHYKELEFEQDQNGSAVEALISINNQLQQTDAAVGILRKAQGYQDFDVKSTWFEKLGRWDEALKAYQRKAEEDPDKFEVTMGKMRCLHALGEWDILSTAAEDKWARASLEHRKAVAPLAAAAAWGTHRWELMEKYLSVMKEQAPDRSFFGAILAIQRNQYEKAAKYIEDARDGLDQELTALLGESYNRAYTVVVRVQMLTELEEIMQYKQLPIQSDNRLRMEETWKKRLLGCQANVEVWQRMLKVREIVITPQENVEMEIKFANLCRKAGRMGLADKSIKLLTPQIDANGQVVPLSVQPAVEYAHYKYRWAAGFKDEALTSLSQFSVQLNQAVAAYRNANMGQGLTQNQTQAQAMQITDLDKTQKLLSKSYLKQGDWIAHKQNGDWQTPTAQNVLSAYRYATHFNPESYKAWHAWALANFEVVQGMSAQAERSSTNVPQQGIHQHVVPAVTGFFKSIALSNSSSLQDTLRLLTLWFAHGGDPEVNTAVVEGFGTVSVDTWLEVIPQLIARINQPNARVRQSIHRLLADVGKAHPQALVYPLAVSMKSNAARRSHSAGQIMDSMKEHSKVLVEQANLISQELIRVAVLWHELWHEALEDASRLYFGEQNADGMFAVLDPLHQMLQDGPKTLRETSFAQAFGRDLDEARVLSDRFKTGKDVGDIHAAWDLYYNVFRKITRQLPSLMTLDLKYVSPKLKEAHDLELAVPGTYRSGKPVIKIVNFDPIFTVIASKQRPRKMTLRGSDGVAYTYLLKGHEDIRQDERVMQLFGLVNTLLLNDAESFKRHLSIQQFPAIPLSQNSGLLGWVPHSDTLHNLIKEYRESRKILLNIEHRIMLQMAPDYDNLTLMQKVEVFGYAMDNTTGKDLYRVLWLKSPSSESWLERRTQYTRSLGVMSIVGYILGLGDRHPSNLMLDSITGQIIHIDFGDCFEIAMHREKYPERVPFRLTRMLTFAMEISNIEGSFRITCEAVMRVIRANKESLMAVLEAVCIPRFSSRSFFC